MNHSHLVTFTRWTRSPASIARFFGSIQILSLTSICLNAPFRCSPMFYYSPPFPPFVSFPSSVSVAPRACPISSPTLLGSTVPLAPRILDPRERFEPGTRLSGAPIGETPPRDNCEILIITRKRGPDHEPGHRPFSRSSRRDSEIEDARLLKLVRVCPHWCNVAAVVTESLLRGLRHFQPASAYWNNFCYWNHVQ